MLEISKILTVFLDDYTNFEVVAQATDIDPTYKNKIGIDYSNFEEILEIQGLLKHLHYDLDEIRTAFQCHALDYINFEYWN
jgi:hypothetical protein